ncbi:hypothetical protein [Halopenitus sp. POP-27]|uniref:hypothetical protein n=1 Tax=Halopenitus sp. POP-27 TaxID=2994425 RepID=UPI00246941A8|nr:hypothetical protein [Halopenitus sp. POP-27]
MTVALMTLVIQIAGMTNGLAGFGFALAVDRLSRRRQRSWERRRPFLERTDGGWWEPTVLPHESIA